MFRLLLQSVISFVKEHGQMSAGSISCFFMLSFIPFFIFITSVLGMIFAGHDALHAYLLARISDIFPAITEEVTGELSRILQNSDVGLFTLLGYLFFF
ncbi:MAG: YhjD/YihY/BrkB family envelope integrity protein [Syntrophales bacterium]|nr:YhjD/YihY/BrkB family envelope integrity protein [Syntrophales bacterium]